MGTKKTSKKTGKKAPKRAKKKASKGGRKRPSAARPRATGEPPGPKLKLTPEVIEIIGKGLRDGLSLGPLAEACMIKADTAYRWKAQGFADLEAGRDTIFAAFGRVFLEERLAGMRKNLADLREAGQKNWQALRWLLKVQAPEHFSDEALARLSEMPEAADDEDLKLCTPEERRKIAALWDEMEAIIDAARQRSRLQERARLRGE